MRRCRTPRLRGVAPLHELDAAGVPVMVASDNTRDPFYAYGDLDMLEVFREATRILHFDHSQRPWTRLLGATAAGIMGLAGKGTIAVGLPADLVLTRARTPQELMSRPQWDRVVIVAGRQIDTTLPDYRELDRSVCHANRLSEKRVTSRNSLMNFSAWNSAVSRPFSAVASEASPAAPEGWMSWAIQPKAVKPVGRSCANSLAIAIVAGAKFAAFSMRTRSGRKCSISDVSMSPAWMPTAASSSL